MKTITLKNFRSLKDTGPVAIQPITILLGQNSSGKSTFLRSLALLKQGIGVRTREPFLWVGELVDFGGFTETLSTFSGDRVVTFAYELEMPLYDYLARSVMRAGLRQAGSNNIELQNIRVSISERSGRPPNTKESFEYQFEFGDDSIDFALSAEGDFLRFEINGRNYIKYVERRLSVKVWRGPLPEFTRFSTSDSFEETDKTPSFATAVSQFISHRSHHRTGDERRRLLAYRLTRAPLSRLLDAARSARVGDVNWMRAVRGWSENSEEYKELRALLIGFRFIDIIAHINEHTSAILENIKYVTPLRANAERYYRKLGLAVNELDPKGTNFALFLDNMSPMERKAFSEWSAEFFGVSIDLSEGGGHLSLHLKSADPNAHSVNIADTGFGFSQMFPILAQLWAAQKTRIYRGGTRQPITVLFAIEQPELHLHPRLQAKLADVFGAAVGAARSLGIDLRLIIETHSEYLVNRLGYLIAAKKFDHADASVLIFEREEFSQPTSLRRATYSEEGFLENWPFGFFEPSI